MEKYNFEEEVKNRLIDAINDGYLVGKDISEIHNEVYNSDYFVIGYFEAEQYLIQHEGVFAAIREITEYETSNFGEVTTDLTSSEKVCNMLAYIYGEKLLFNLDCLSNFVGEVTEELLQEMLNELEN